MADRLSDDVAVSLLGNTIPTGAILVVLISILGPISGAHFNPAVTMVFAARREIEANAAALYVLAQVLGGIAGTLIAHAMFDLQLFQVSETARTGTGQWIAEAVATAGLLLVILRAPASRVAARVACYIGAAYWFTASTSFANPAAAFGRMFSDSFAGISPASVPGFVVAELIGAGIGVAIHMALSPTVDEVAAHSAQDVAKPGNATDGTDATLPPA
jgi:glycerol uptake facilitator-like aquaporin